MEGFIGEVKYFAGTYPPKNWAFCEGQSLPIVQYTPLYSLIGVQFGGDGKTYFNLPDLRGRMTLGAGQSTGTSYRHQGDTGGYEGVQLTQLTLPAHNHTMKCDTTSGGRTIKTTPQNNLFALKAAGGYGPDPTGLPSMKNDMVNTEGQSAAHENMPPWLCVNYIICLYGYYPIRP
jgi:microcystin-dependent protein